MDELDSKVCQNCVQSYQDKEVIQLKLNEAQRKIERLENQLKTQQSSGTDSAEVVDNLRSRLETEMKKAEDLQGKLRDAETQRDELSTTVATLEEKLEN